MKVVFRADANHSIGMGHIMRCLSFADAFRDFDGCVLFVLADNTALNIVTERGYDVKVLSSDYRDMESELSLWSQIDCDYLIVDSYYVTSNYLSSLRERIHAFKGQLVYVDDVYSFPYPVDILVNYGVYASDIKYNELYVGYSGNMPSLILGLSYAPLRSMFEGIEKKVQTKTVRNVLVSTGGSDELHLSVAIIRYLLNRESQKTDAVDNITYHFLLGEMNPDKEEIKKLSANNSSIVLHEDVTDMKSLIQSVDIVVSAAGSTLYEICACGVPLITYSLADNQILGAKSFERLGVAINIGDVREPTTIKSKAIISGALDKDATYRIMTAIEKLSKNYKKRVNMGQKMQKLVDGYGASRLVKRVIEEKTVLLKKWLLKEE